MAKKKKGLGASFRQQVNNIPVVQQKAPRTISTNVSTGGGGLGASFKTATQKAEEERSARMRQGISSVVRASFKRQMSQPTTVQKSALKPLATNALQPVKNTSTGFKMQVRKTLAPVKDVAKYTRQQEAKYATPSQEALLGRRKIDIETGKALRAGNPSNSNILMSWRETPTAEEIAYRQKYGYDQSFSNKQVTERLDNSGVNRDKVAAPKRVQAMHGSDDLMQAKEFTPLTWDDVRSGFADVWALKNPEDTMERQYGRTVDDATREQLEAQRSTGGYAAGMMAGQMTQYALTRGALSGLGIVGKAAQAEKVAKAAGNLNKARAISFGSELGIDQAASLPLNILDAFKENSPQEIWNRFKMNQGLDVLFSGVTTGISIANNPAFKEAKALHESANELRASGNKAMADATDMAAYKKMGEVPKPELDKAENDAIVNIIYDRKKPVSQNEAEVIAPKSVVRDYDGQMQMVFHGSADDFWEFDKNKIRPDDYDAPFNGFWFSSSEDALPAFVSVKYRKAFYLDIKNPAPLEVWESVSEQVYKDEILREGARSYGDEVRYRLQDMGYDGVHWDGAYKFSKENLDEFNRFGKTTFENGRGIKYDLVKQEDGSASLVKTGRDPYYDQIDEFVDGEDFFEINNTNSKWRNEDVWVAFEPEQIIPTRNRMRGFTSDIDRLNNNLDNVGKKVHQKSYLTDAEKEEFYKYIDEANDRGIRGDDARRYAYRRMIENRRNPNVDSIGERYANLQQYASVDKPTEKLAQAQNEIRNTNNVSDNATTNAAEATSGNNATAETVAKEKLENRVASKPNDASAKDALDRIDQEISERFGEPTSNEVDVNTLVERELEEKQPAWYTSRRGESNGAEKHQSTVERAGSGEEEVRANVGAVQNGERQAVGGTHLENQTNPASTGRTGRTLSLTDEQRAVMDAAGKTNANLREADYSAFSNALNEGKASNKYGSYVDPQDVDELTKKGAKTFLSDDGSVGFAITKDGDMIGAFNRGGKYRGAVDDMLITARLNGGTKLDCYGIGLVNKYEQAGYIPVARIPFNPEYVNDPLLLANKPDVYVMMKNGDDIDTVIRKNANGEYHVSSPEELDALRTFDDYDAALKYRDDLLAKQENPKANTAQGEPKETAEPKAEIEEPKAEAKEEKKEDNRTWQEHAREDYKTGKQRAKAVEEGKIPSRENGEVVNAIKRLKETKDFSNVKDALNRGVKDGIYNRKIRHLDEEIDKAIKEIEADPEKAINDVLDYHPNGAKANDVPADAIPWVMKGYALCKWADVNGMTALKEDIAATMAKAQSTGGSILRAGQVFTVMADTKTQRDIVEEYVKKMQEKYASRLGDHKLSVSEDLLNKLDNATTDAEKSKILDDITVHVWNQVPQSFIEAMGSFRIVSMLANTTTMIRNLASNAGFLGVREVDKSVNTMMEATAEKLNKIDRAHRTHTIYNPFSKENRKIQAYWYSDYGKHRNIIKGQSRWDEGGGTLSLDLRPQEGRHFGIKAGGGRKGGLIGVASAGLEGTRKATSWIMDTGDEAFLAPAYADAATQLMVVRGWKVEDLTPARVQEIRDYATLVAQQATYRDPSEFATALAKWGHWQKGDGALRLVRAVGVSGLQPFKKTPINVGKRAVEYSPIGFVKGVYDIRSAIKAGDSTAVNKAITELSKGTTGTGLVVAGYLLAEQGVINAQLPTDDEGYLRRDLGEQDYALNIGGKSRSLQWAAPGAIPILSGATLYDQVQQRGWNTLLKPQTLVSVLSKSANPLLEMSFMQSYMDIAESTDDVKSVDKFFVGMEQIGLSYAAQYVPTMLGKIANLVDPVRRDTSSQSTDPYVKAYERFINKSVINKIPFKSKSLPAYRDAFGNIQTTEDVKDRIIQNFVSPWYTKEIKTDDPVFKELFRINNATPDTNLIPTNSIGKGKHELSLNGETINLDPHDMDEYKRIRGEGNQKALEFIDSDGYKSMSDTERAKALEDIYENAKVDAKRQMLLKKGKSEWDVYTEGFEGGKAEQIGAAKNAGIDPKDYNHTLTDKTADADGNGTVSKSEYYDYLLRQNQYNDKQRAVLMAAKNKSWDGKYNPFVTGEPPKDSQAAHAESTSYTDDIKSTGLSEKQFKEITSADTARIDSNGSGRVSQKEYQAYLDSFSYLTDEQKSALWKKYNPHWKKNPYDGSTASSGSSKRGRSGRRSSGGGSSKAKARAKTASEKRFAALQTGKAPTNAKGIEALSQGAKGLTKAQKKALLKLMQKKLEV